jgi:hypothetical protein
MPGVCPGITTCVYNTHTLSLYLRICKYMICTHTSRIRTLGSTNSQKRTMYTREHTYIQGEDVIYGQIVQLRHISGDQITVQKTMAKFESQCLKVTMDEHGDEGSWFRIEPAFKFRNFGQRVPHGDRCVCLSHGRPCVCVCVCTGLCICVLHLACEMTLQNIQFLLHACVCACV